MLVGHFPSTTNLLPNPASLLPQSRCICASTVLRYSILLFTIRYSLFTIDYGWLVCNCLLDCYIRARYLGLTISVNGLYVSTWQCGAHAHNRVNARQRIAGVIRRPAYSMAYYIGWAQMPSMALQMRGMVIYVAR